MEALRSQQAVRVLDRQPVELLAAHQLGKAALFEEIFEVGERRAA
jgi:hypothetical protein